MLLKALQAGVQSGTIMSVADVTTQWLVEGKDFSWLFSTGTTTTTTIADNPGKKKNYDVTRTLQWTLAGLVLHGPYFSLGFGMMDKRLGAATSFRVVAQKTALAQFVLFPPYLVALFGLMGILEQQQPKMILEKIRTKVPQAFLSGCLYWPIANGLNFAMIPATLRVPYVACAAGLWNGYLSWENARDTNTIRGADGAETVVEGKKDY